MCEWGSNVRRFVPICAEDHHLQDGEMHWEYKPVDFCIADIVDALNKAGVYTRASCCGHFDGIGSIPLHDGRILYVWLPRQEVSTETGCASDAARELARASIAP